MQRNQLSRITKEELIESILASPGQDDGQLGTLTETLLTIVSEVADIKKVITAPDSVINKKLADLQVQVDRQADVIAKQQRFLETLDRKEREKNLVILGLPEEDESLDGATLDIDKIKKIWCKVGVQEEIASHRRLGDRNRAGAGNRKRPILVTTTTRDAKDNVLNKASILKTAGDNYNRIYIKKDVHPSVRMEWKRLRSVEAAEKERPENVGCVIRLDTRERKLYRDDVVIDVWNPQFF